MSKASKRKHVTKEVMDEFVLPEGERKIVKVRDQISMIIYFFFLYQFTVAIVTMGNFGKLFTRMSPTVTMVTRQYQLGIAVTIQTMTQAVVIIMPWK